MHGFIRLIRWALPLVLSAAFTGGPVAAQTVSPGQIFSSGGIFHRQVCAGTAPAGQANCHSHVVTDQAGAARTDDVSPPERKRRGQVFSPFTVPQNGAGASPNAAPTPNATTSAAPYGVTDIRAAYGLGPAPTSCTSFGPLVAIVDAYGYASAEADLAKYRSTYGLPACTTANGCFRKYNQNGGTSYPAQNLGWAQEQALDLDMVSAVCPCCKIALVQSTTNSYTSLGTAVNRAATLGAIAISNSYGGSESGTTSIATSYYNNHPNSAVVASSGDSGYGVQFPASASYVIGVGGTSLKGDASARGFTETVWSGSGSGCSQVFGKQIWQTDTGCSKRTVTDIAAVADPATGVAVYAPTNTTGGAAWYQFGGTSVAAPIIAGLYGLAGALPATSATCSSSYPACALYRLRGTTAFNDVISGSNATSTSSCGASTSSTYYLCNGGSGYDGPTGLGTPTGLTGF